LIATAADAKPRDRALFLGARWGMVATTILMILLPNSSPRYLYPLIVVPCLLLGRALTVENGSGLPVWLPSVWRKTNLLLLTIVSLGVAGMPLLARGDRWILLWSCLEGFLAVGVWFFAIAESATGRQFVPPVDKGRLSVLALTSGAVTAIGMMLFATVVLPKVDSANKHRAREVAAEIQASVPAGELLWVLEDGYRPFWYYLEPNVRYFHRLADLPAGAHYILLSATQTHILLQNSTQTNSSPVLIKQMMDNENRVFNLFVCNKMG
jgi:hypothetical protein